VIQVGWIEIAAGLSGVGMYVCKMPAKHKLYSVYPEPEKMAHTGTSSRDLNVHLGVTWPDIIRTELPEIIAEIPERRVWEFLSVVSRDHFHWLWRGQVNRIKPMPPMTELLGKAIRAQYRTGLPQIEPEDMAQLERVIHDFRITGCWIIVLVAHQRWENPPPDRTAEWWTLEYRVAHNLDKVLPH